MTTNPGLLPIITPNSAETLYLPNGVWKVDDYARDANNVVWQLQQSTSGRFYWSRGPHSEVQVHTWLQEPHGGPALPIQKVVFIPAEDEMYGTRRLTFRDALHMATDIFKDVTVEGDTDDLTGVIIGAAKQIMEADPAL